MWNLSAALWPAARENKGSSTVSSSNPVAVYRFPPFSVNQPSNFFRSYLMGSVGSHRWSCSCRTRAPPGAASGTFSGVAAEHHHPGRLRLPSFPAATTTKHRHRPPMAVTMLLLGQPRTLWQAIASPAQQQSLSPCRICSMYVVQTMITNNLPIWYNTTQFKRHYTY